MLNRWCIKKAREFYAVFDSEVEGKDEKLAQPLPHF
jgi:hypothetical protein